MLQQGKWRKGRVFFEKGGALGYNGLDMKKEFHHVTVLLKETVDSLNIKPDGVYVDATLGGAGHSEYLLSQLSEEGHLYAFDQDEDAIRHAQVRLAPYVDNQWHCGFFWT